jgi:hypothetical protein
MPISGRRSQSVGQSTPSSLSCLTRQPTSNSPSEFEIHISRRHDERSSTYILFPLHYRLAFNHHLTLRHRGPRVLFGQIPLERAGGVVPNSYLFLSARVEATTTQHNRTPFPHPRPRPPSSAKPRLFLSSSANPNSEVDPSHPLVVRMHGCSSFYSFFLLASIVDILSSSFWTAALCSFYCSVWFAFSRRLRYIPITSSFVCFCRLLGSYVSC